MKIFLIALIVLSIGITAFFLFTYVYSALGSGVPLRILRWPLWINNILNLAIIGVALFYFYGHNSHVLPSTIGIAESVLFCLQIITIIITFTVILG